jgi:hypothetical protein
MAVGAPPQRAPTMMASYIVKLRVRDRDYGTRHAAGIGRITQIATDPRIG